MAGSDITTPCFPVRDTYELVEEGGGTRGGRCNTPGGGDGSRGGGVVVGEDGSLLGSEEGAEKDPSLSSTEQRRLLSARRELEKETFSETSRSERTRRLIRHRPRARRNTARKSAIEITKSKKMRKSE